LSDPAPPSLIFLDSCAIVNLFATARFESLIACLDGEAHVVDYVVRESQFIRTRLPDGSDERQPIQLDPLLRRGVLHVCELESEAEFVRFLELAVRLDDGEAATLAVAAQRDGIVITDDRKALAIAHELAIPTSTTLAVVRQWAERTASSHSEVTEVLERIRSRARYVPARNHPLRPWWEEMIGSGELT